jgi:hypothetical protein
MDRRFVWRDQSHDLKIETAFGRSFFCPGIARDSHPITSKKSGPGFLRDPTYTACGVHPTALPSWFHIVMLIGATVDVHATLSA